jgi:hypothetical protein
MNNKQLLGLGLVSAAGIGAFFLLRNKQSKATTPIIAPQRQSTSLVNEDSERKKLYDEVYLALIELMKAHRMYLDDKGLNEVREKFRYYGDNNDSLSKLFDPQKNKNKLWEAIMLALVGKENPVEAANVILDFEMPTLEKMSTNEINLYLYILKAQIPYINKLYFDAEGFTKEITKDPIKYRDILKLNKDYEIESGTKGNLLTYIYED